MTSLLPKIWIFQNLDEIGNIEISKSSQNLSKNKRKTTSCSYLWGVWEVPGSTFGTTFWCVKWSHWLVKRFKTWKHWGPQIQKSFTTTYKYHCFSLIIKVFQGFGIHGDLCAEGTWMTPLNNQVLNLYGFCECRGREWPHSTTKFELS